MALILTGRVVTFDGDDEPIDDGAVYVGDDGRIEAVGPASDPPPAGFAQARRIATGAAIYPGLIDLHNHIAYNTLPLWEAPSCPYLHHDRWPSERKEPDYSGSVSWPAKVLQQAAPEALLKYVEVKALIGGTTSIQGAPRTTRDVDGWLCRIIDNERFGGPDLIACSVLQKPVPKLREDGVRMASKGSVLIYHGAEGKRQSLVRREFTDLEAAGCLQPGLICVHATALERKDFKTWQQAVRALDPQARANVVWSPFSNLWLYDQSTFVDDADAEGVRICLGSDWAPSGTKHVLGELKVADVLNRTNYNGRFSDRELCDMVTANPGDALGVAVGEQLGRIKAGLQADLVVVEDRHADAYRNLIAATERQVRLVLVRGQAFYGTPGLMTAAGAPASDPITVRGQRRRIVVRQPGHKDALLDWPAVRKRLEDVRRDPLTAWRDSNDALAAWGGPLDDPDAPLAIFGDMPEGDLGLLGAAAEPPADLKIPRLDALTHDAAFFKAVGRSAAEELHELAAYYA